MLVGDFKFVLGDDGRMRMTYVDPKPKLMLTTASPDNNRLLKELLNERFGLCKIEPPLWEKWTYEAPPLEFKKEEETAMEKDMKDYIGCYLKEVEFKPPYTTILWGDGTATQVKCIDEPYDPEKGFAMAIQKKLFGRNYYKHMEIIIKRDGGYEKATQLVKLMDGKFFCYADTDSVRVDNAADEIEKLKKENEYLKRSNELMSNNIQSLTTDITNIRLVHKLADDANVALKSANSSYKKVINDLNKRIDDLKKAKENMAKKLAETKQLKKDLDAQMLKNGELDRENQKLCRDAEIKSNLIDRQREDIHKLKEWFEREAAKVKRLQACVQVLDLENKKIEQIKEILK